MNIYKFGLLVFSTTLLFNSFGVQEKFYAEETVNITLDDIGENIDIHSDLQYQYLTSEDLTTTSGIAYGDKEISTPKSLPLTFSVSGATNLILESYTIELSKDIDFYTIKTYDAIEEKIEVTNLEIGTTYYWRVHANYEGDISYTSEISKFSTSSLGPRNLNVPNVSNFRDLGGIKVAKGKRIKQGLIYRCGTLNQTFVNYQSNVATSEGRKILKEDLKIKTEIDLRHTDTTEHGDIVKSIMGSSINYYSLTMEYDVDDFLQYNKSMLRLAFTYLGNTDNYPLLMHCAIGTDRTGVVAYILNALLGKSELDIEIDYLFSNFSSVYWQRSVNDIRNSTRTLKTYPGETLQQKAYNYLVDIGVKPSKLDTIIDYCIEDFEE